MRKTAQRRSCWFLGLLLVLVALGGCGDGSTLSAPGGTWSDDDGKPSPNAAPTASAGADRDVTVGDPVTLDGRNSYDPDGDLITYLWGMTEKPSESTASLNNPASVMPTFVPDQPGNYVVALTVTDGQATSAPDEVLVTAARPNVAPTAYAGPDQSVVTGSVVHLDGTGSFDPEGDAFTYQWQFIANSTPTYKS